MAILDKVGNGAVWLFGKIGDGIAWLIKHGFEFLVNGLGVLSGYDDIFVLIGIAGLLVVITGRKDLGVKITSGSFIAYAICKAVAQ